MKFTIESLDSVSSTQDIIKHKLEADPSLPEGYVITAKDQTKGRGRHGRTWEGSDGNLYFSFLLKPDAIQPDKIGLLSLAVGLAVFQTLKPLIKNLDINIKWPNDILIEGKKISGILIELFSDQNNTPQAFIVGIGINIKSSPMKDSTCLDSLTKQGYVPENILYQFLSNFKKLYAQWKSGEFESLIESYKAGNIPKGQGISVKLPNQTHEGHYYDIDHNGNLILEKKDGSLVTITSGDVYLCD